ncbi:MAG: hypothetical protein IKV46_07215 [Bacteroidales bacterium]|jgi:hypothetical protein|nr:hypothetical protein [Bacteroidales bacterium]
MRRFFVFIFTIVLSSGLFAQKHITKFLNIPIDGSGKDMIQKLKDKGFSYSQKDDVLVGVFNGEMVAIDVHSQQDKVWRLIIEDLSTRDEEQIVERFNSLVRQFENSNNYMPFIQGQAIKKGENLAYDMSKYGVIFRAGFYQKGDSWLMKDERFVWFMIVKIYSRYKIVMYYENGYNEGTDEVI